MSVVSSKIVDKIEYYEEHVPVWTPVATTIGLSSAICTDLQTKTDAARDAYTAQQNAMNAAKAATTTLRNALRALSVAGGNSIKQIRATAERTGNWDIFAMAQIPAPTTPEPVGELGKPYKFKATLAENGVVELGWKCTQPKAATGTVYTVYRRIGGTGEYKYLGGTGMKKFFDSDLPAGSTEVQYQVQAVRSTSVGPFAQFNVNFGVPGGTTTVTETTPAKIAA